MFDVYESICPRDSYKIPVIKDSSSLSTSSFRDRKKNDFETLELPHDLSFYVCSKRGIGKRP